MNNNIFAFGDTFWLQKAGAAMGMPPDPTWATIYFSIWEITIIPEFDELKYYRCYIDNGFALWLPQPGRDNALCLTQFKEKCNPLEQITLFSLQQTKLSSLFNGPLATSCPPQCSLISTYQSPMESFQPPFTKRISISTSTSLHIPATQKVY